MAAFADCCALAASGHVAAAQPSSVMNSRRFMSDMAFSPTARRRATGEPGGDPRQPVCRNTQPNTE
jgi:hypothetical protein